MARRKPPVSSGSRSEKPKVVVQFKREFDVPS